MRTEYANGELADLEMTFVQVIDDFLPPMPIYMFEASDPCPDPARGHCTRNERFARFLPSRAPGEPLLMPLTPRTTRRTTVLPLP